MIYRNKTSITISPSNLKWLDKECKRISKVRERETGRGFVIDELISEKIKLEVNQTK